MGRRAALRWAMGWSLVLLAVALGFAAAGRPSIYDQLSAARRQGMQLEVRRLIAFLEGYHYRSRPFVEIDTRVVIDAYLNRLDPMRLFFLAADEKFIQRRFGRSLKSSYLLSGDIYPAYEIYDLFRERFDARQAWLRTRLEQPFDLEGDEVFDWDRSDATWCANAAAADAEWERYLKSALITELLLNDDRDWAVGRIRRWLDERVKAVAAKGPEDIEEGFLNVLLALQDPHSGYDSWDTVLDRDVEMSGALVGIGADLKIIEGEVVIDRLHPGGAADLSGVLRRGDRIAAMAEADSPAEELAGLPLQDIVTKIRGEAGTRIVLRVHADGEGETREVALERSRVEVSETRASATIFDLPGDGDAAVRVGVIDLPRFYGDGEPPETSKSSAGADVGELLRKLEGAGVAAVVLDLRSNPGGFNVEAVRVAGQFIDRGPVFITRRSDGYTETLEDLEAGAAWGGPLVVLTSNRSASASEVVSGALQAYGRAVVVGSDRTFGKGTSQAVIPLGERETRVDKAITAKWGSLRLTMMRFYLPNGDGTQVKGVVSDVQLPHYRPSYFRLEGDLPGALPWDRIAVPEFAGSVEAAVRGLAVASPGLRAHLTEQTAGRVGTLPEFDWYQRRLDYWKGLGTNMSERLNLEERRRQREEQRTKRRALEEERRRLGSELALTSQRVTLDSVKAQEEAHRRRALEGEAEGDDPRANRLIEDTYFHQAAPGEPTVELHLSSIDFDDFRDDADELASVFAGAAELALSGAQLATIFSDQSGATPGDEDTLLDRMAAVTGVEADAPALRAGLAAMLARIVALDPAVLGDAARLDVALRESLRLAADWVAWSKRVGGAAL